MRRLSCRSRCGRLARCLLVSIAALLDPSRLYVFPLLSLIARLARIYVNYRRAHIPHVSRLSRRSRLSGWLHSIRRPSHIGVPHLPSLDNLSRLSHISRVTLL